MHSTDAMLLPTENGFVGLRDRDSSDLISMVSFTFTMLRHLIRLASVRLAKFEFRSFWLPCAKPGNKAECTVYGGWVKTLVLF